MKSYLVGTIYITLLAMAFAFFAFMDRIDVGLSINPTKKTVPAESEVQVINEDNLSDYTFSPLRFDAGYN